jgi:hypothetical protein
MNIDPDIWQHVSGIEFDGPTVQKDLQDLLSGKGGVSETQWEVLTDLYREGGPSTAGYAAVPLLLEPHEQVPPKLAWALYSTAGQIVAAIGKPDSPRVPDALGQIRTEATRLLAIERILVSAGKADLSVAELLYTFQVMMELKGRSDLTAKLEGLFWDESRAGHG